MFEKNTRLNRKVYKDVVDLKKTHVLTVIDKNRKKTYQRRNVNVIQSAKTEV